MEKNERIKRGPFCQLREIIGRRETSRINENRLEVVAALENTLAATSKQELAKWGPPTEYVIVASSHEFNTNRRPVRLNCFQSNSTFQTRARDCVRSHIAD